jgi:hypothetical protein
MKSGSSYLVVMRHYTAFKFPSHMLTPSNVEVQGIRVGWTSGKGHGKGGMSFGFKIVSESVKLSFGKIFFQGRLCVLEMIVQLLSVPRHDVRAATRRRAS